MVRLYEVAEKLGKLLNGTDSETPAGYSADYDFQVATEGFHLDKISNKNTRKNFIPVFVGSFGGTYNPIPYLKEADYTLTVTLYYPVRFKNDFYALNDYLVECFVGKTLNYGTYSGKCLSNISVAQYGEIAPVDLEELSSWTLQTYSKEISVTESYMSMTFNLYLTTIGSDYLLGNDIKMNLQLSYEETYTKYITYNATQYERSSVNDKTLPNGNKIYCYGLDSTLYYTYSEFAEVGDNLYSLNQEQTQVTLVGTITAITRNERTITNNLFSYSAFDDLNIQSNTEPAGQQLIGQLESDGLPITTAYSGGFTLYYDSSIELFRNMLSQWCLGNSQKLRLNVTLYGGINFSRNAYLSSCHLSLKKGEPVTFTITFAKRKV